MPDIIINTNYIWLIAAVVFLIIEAATVGLTMIWFAAGAFAALLLSLVGLPVWAQITGFIAVSAFALWQVKPVVQKYVIKKKVTTNFDMIIGREGMVTNEIDNSKPSGLVRVIGQDWTARSATGEIIPKDTRVRVISVEGVKAFVVPAPSVNERDAQSVGVIGRVE